jgi:hypothetical protein
MNGRRAATVTGSSTPICHATSPPLTRDRFYRYAAMHNLNKADGILEIAGRENLQLEVTELEVNDDHSLKDAVKAHFCVIATNIISTMAARRIYIR